MIQFLHLLGFFVDRFIITLLIVVIMLLLGG